MDKVVCLELSSCSRARAQNKNGLTLTTPDRKRFDICSAGRVLLFAAGVFFEIDGLELFFGGLDHFDSIIHTFRTSTNTSSHSFSFTLFNPQHIAEGNTINTIPISPPSPHHQPNHDLQSRPLNRPPSTARLRRRPRRILLLVLCQC